jgi:hypothetical protein
MKLSAVIASRNDNYGGQLNKRAQYCLNAMLGTFDEVIYVDWNSPGGRPLTDDIQITVNPERLQVIVVTPEKARELMGDEGYEKGQKCCEVLARNVGIRRATGDIVVSTNIDIIPPKRVHLDELLTQLSPKSMITLAKHDITVDLLEKLPGPYQNTIPMAVGLNSLNNRLIIPCNLMNKNMIDRIPDVGRQKLHAASVIEACGDFQIAHRETWHDIRGFEEDRIKRLFNDTIVQYKVIMNDGSILATNFPPLYHIDHERNNAPDLLNHEELPAMTRNPETWGFSNEKFLV